MQTENAKAAQLYQISLILWAAFLVSQLMFFVVLLFTRPQLFTLNFTQPLWGPTPAMTGGFAIAAIIVFVLSFSFKKKFNERAVEQQDIGLVQTGLIIAFALCEACSLFGICLAFAFEYQYFFAWNILGIVGIVLHFPKKDAGIAATFKQQ